MNVGSMAFFLFALESMNTNLEIVAIKKVINLQWQCHCYRQFI